MSKNSKIFFGITFAVVLIAAAVFFLFRPERQAIQNGTSPVTVRLGYRPTALADVTPVIIKEGGLGSTPDLKIELIPVADPRTALQKFDAGEVDALAGLTVEAILQRMASQGDPKFKAYYFQVDLEGEGWVSIVANQKTQAQTVKDLAGKTVASLPTDQAQYLLRRILKSAGVPDSEIKIVKYNPATPLTGLDSGEHDAIFGLEPAISRAAAKGHRILSRGPVSEYLYDGKAVPVSASVISKEFASRHPQAVERFLSVIDRAVEIQNTNPQTVRGYFSKKDYGELEPNVVQNLFLPVMRKPTSEVRPVLDQFASDLFTDGILKAKVNNDLLIN